MRILHTSDWHLGHSLHDHDREVEHKAFLAWLLDVLESRHVDAMLVAGDIFDTSNPSASAQGMYYRFLMDLRTRIPDLDVLVVGGNHDSASRLDAPRPILASMRVHVVGGMHRDGASLDPAELVLPLRARDGRVGAWVAAVPFLRTADLDASAGAPRPDPDVDEAGDAPRADGTDPLVDGVRRVYAHALAEARRRREPGQALVATGHCYMVGTTISELSERRILGGNQHALPVEIFPDDLSYVALGHLHKAQIVGRRESVRYSGSPIPLSMSEVGYRHQVCIVDLDGDGPARVETLEIPRSVPMRKVPRKGGSAPLDDVLAEIRGLDLEADTKDTSPEARALRPFLEVNVSLDRPDPTVRTRIEAELKDRLVRLVGIRVTGTGTGQALSQSTPDATLHDLGPEAVFLACYQRTHEGDPSPELLAAFHELRDSLGQ